MKKVIVALIMVLMIASMTLSALAASGGFVSSPSGNQAPVLVKGANTSKKCESVLTVTSYADRDKLSENSKNQIEAAYAQIVATTDVSKLNASVAEVAKDVEVGLSDLAVSDLFDISASTCSDHEKHKKFKIELQSDTVKNFVCLLHYNNGEWEVVKGAKIDKNENILKFKTDELSPFAIVVSSGAKPQYRNYLAAAIATGVGVCAVGVGAGFAFVELDGVNYIKKLLKLKKK